MEKIQRAWMRPELLILTRSKPEEAVLAACKNNSAKIGPGSSAAQCKNWPAACSINATS